MAPPADFGMGAPPVGYGAPPPGKQERVSAASLELLVVQFKLGPQTGQVGGYGAPGFGGGYAPAPGTSMPKNHDVSGLNGATYRYRAPKGVAPPQGYGAYPGAPPQNFGMGAPPQGYGAPPPQSMSNG